MTKSHRLWDNIVSRLGKFSRKSADQHKRLKAMKSRHLQLEQCEDRLLLSIAPLMETLTPEEQFVENVIAYTSTTPFDQWDIDWGDTAAEMQSNLSALVNDPRWDAICGPYRQDTSSSSLPASSSAVNSLALVGPALPSMTSAQTTFLSPSLLGGGMVMMMSAGTTSITLSDPTGPIGYNETIEVDEGSSITLTADLTNLVDELTEWTINWGDETIVVTPPESGNDWGNGVKQIDADTWEFTHTYADGEDHQYIRVYGELTDTEQETATIYKYIAIPGDANLDGVVDGSDATTQATHWGYSPDATWEMGDFNYDGVVDGSDSTTLASNWQDSLANGDGGITVNNVAPTLTVAGDLFLEYGETYTFTFSADDPGDDHITSWDVDWQDGDQSSGNINNSWGDFTYHSETNTWTITHTFDDDIWLDQIEIVAEDSDNCEVCTAEYQAMVTSLADSGTDPGLELREALYQLDQYSGTNDIAITFDPGLFSSSPGIITLNGNALQINSDVTIVGPGSGDLTVRADVNNPSGVFEVDDSVTTTISGITIANGSATYGGGIYGSTGSNITLTNVILDQNSATSKGGGIYVSSGSTLSITDSTISGNTSSSNAGGVNATGPNTTVTISGSTFSGNTAVSGGGLSLYSSATGTISNTTFSNNTASTGDGGGLWLYGASDTTTITDTTFSDNDAGNCGGAIYSYNTASTITNTDILDNEATYGGGIFIHTSTIATNIIYSTFLSNEAATNGGGISIMNLSSIVNVSGCLLAENEAGSKGGGLYLSSADTVTVVNSTIADNYATSNGGGIYRGAGDLVLKNSIAADNDASSGPDIYGTVKTAGSLNNLVSNGTGFTGISNGNNGNQIGVDPQFLDSPNDNWRLDNGSPAINAGDNSSASSLNTDLDGVDRIIDTTVDIGAYEYGDILVSTTADEDDGDYSYGDLSLREAFYLASLRTGNDTITFDPEFFVGAPSVLFSGTNECEMDSNIIIEVDAGTNVKIDCEISGTSESITLTKSGAGTLIFMDANTYAGTTTISAGTLQVGNGGTAGELGTGNVAVESGAELVFYHTNDINLPIEISNVFSGTGDITLMSNGTKNTGAYKLHGNNSNFTGTLTVTGARVIVDDASELGNSGMSMIYAIDGGQIHPAASGSVTFDRPLTISGDGFWEDVGKLGALRLGNGETWAGDITLAGDASITAYNATATITGDISDGSNGYQLTFTAGTTSLISNIKLNPDNGNTYSGGTIIAGAIVQLEDDNALPSNSEVQLGDPDLGFGILDLKGHAITLSSITTGQVSPKHSLFLDEITNTAGGLITLSINNSVDCEYGGFLSGNLSLVKNGTGTLTLAGSNRNAGTATAYAGTLEITGDYLGNITDNGYAIKPLPAYYTISLGSMSGEQASNFSDSLSVGSQLIPVYGDWKTAIYKPTEGVGGTVSRTTTAKTFTFNALELDQPFRVGTFQEISDAVLARHKNQYVFGLDASLSNTTKLIVLEGDDIGKDYDDVYWVVNAQKVGLNLAGEDEIDEGSVYTLSIGNLTGMAGEVTEYTIDWGDGSESEVYTAAMLEALNFQPTHLYTDGLSTPTIKIDVEINGTNSYECLDYKTITVQDVDPTFTIYGNGGIDIETLDTTGNTRKIIIAADDPGEDVITSLTIYWGSECSTTGTAPYSGNDWGNGITKNTDGTWTATYSYTDDTDWWLNGFMINATDDELHEDCDYEKSSVILVSELDEDAIDYDYSPDDLCLREALDLAEDDDDSHTTIFFDPSLFNSGADSISLAGTVLGITSDVTILGPGADLLTINAGGNSQVFHVGEDVTAILSSMAITGGSASNGGGIYGVDGSDITITDLVIYGNTASSNNDEGGGGGVYVEGNSSVTIFNSLIYENTATYDHGGGIFGADDSCITLVSCTIADNTANDEGGGVFVAAGGTATINNTIIATNSVNNTDHDDIIVYDGLTRNSDYNLIGVWSDTESTPEMYTLYGETGSALDPVFVDDDNDDYRLDSDSPAINVGGNAKASGLATDLDGNGRIFYDTVDIGAYEYTPTIWYWDTNGDTPGFGNGTGTWSEGVDNWTTDPKGETSTDYWDNDEDRIAVFSGTAGTVTISSSVVANSVQFLTSDYTISNGALVLFKGFNSIYAAGGVEATINSLVYVGINDWTKTGAGKVTLTSVNNTFNGKTIVDDGILVAQTTGSLPGYSTLGDVEVHDGATIAVNIGGASEWNNTNDDVQTLLTNATFEGGSALGIDTSNATADVTYGSALAGYFGLTKLGTGTLILSQANTYTGDTTICDGELQITGSIDSSDVIINGGILSDDSGVDDVVVQSGSISPGGSGVDTLTIDDLTFETGAIYTVSLSGTSTDKLVATGDIDLGNATLDLSGTLTDPTPYYDVFVLIDNQGTDDIIGIFDGLPEGSTVTDGTNNYWISYCYDNAATPKFNSGNDVALIAQGTELTAPTLSLDSVATSQIIIDWTDIIGETGYLVQRRTDDSNWVDLESCNAGTITYTDDTVTEGTRYYYRVLPTVNDLYTTSSNVLCVTAKPATPGALSATINSSQSVSLNWTSDNSSNESYYIIQKSVAGGGWETIGTAPADSTEITLTGQSFDSAKIYNFQVMAYCEGPGEQSSDVSAISNVSPGSWAQAPTDLVVTEVSGLSVELGWTNNDPDGTTYYVQRKVEGDDWTTITTLGASAHEHTDDLSAVGEGVYYYRVYAWNATGNSAYSNEVSTGVLATPGDPAVTDMYKDTGENGGYASLVWTDNSSLETSYIIEVSTDGSSWNPAGIDDGDDEVSYDSDPTTNQICAMIPGTYTASTYYFRVSAYSSDLEVSSAFSYSGAVSFTQASIESPSNIVVTQDTTTFDVDITWDAVDGADDYAIYRVGAGETVLLDTTTNTSYTNENLLSDSSYTYKIVARDANGNGSPIGNPAHSKFAYTANGDYDADGLTNYEELVTYGTAVDSNDSDGDGLLDGWEIAHSYNPLDTDSDDNGILDCNEDPDGEGLNNKKEQDAQTDPEDEDSDDDGVSDYEEYEQGSDPNDASDSTPSSGFTGGFTFRFGDISGSKSETWEFTVTDPQIIDEDKNVVDPFSASPGQLTTKELPKMFEAGHTYNIQLSDIHSEDDIYDYDWCAYLDPGPDPIPHDIFNKSDLFGVFWQDEENPQVFAGKTVKLWIPRMDVTIDNKTLWVDTDDTNGLTTVPAGRYLNITFASNISDIGLNWENTKVELEYDDGQVAIYKNPYTLDEIYLDQSYSLSELGAYQDQDGNIQIDLYVEGIVSLTEASLIEVYADIRGSNGENGGASVYDTVDVFVVDVDTAGDVDVDSDNNDEAGIPDHSEKGEESEDAIEEKDPGKYIAVQRNNQTGTRFVPLTLKIDPVFFEICEDPEVRFVGGENLKLWDGDLSDGGKTQLHFYSYSNTTYSASELGIDESWTTLYIEATGVGTPGIELQINLAGEESPEWVTLDTVNFTVLDESTECKSCSSDTPNATGVLTIDNLDIGGSHMMYLLLTGNAIAIVDQCGTTIFDHDSSPTNDEWVYRTTGEESALKLSEVGSTYVCTGPEGTEYIFSAEEENLGKLLEIQYIGLGSYSMFFDDDGRLIQTISDRGDGTQETIEYTYNDKDQIITATVAIDGDASMVTQYFYYGEKESGGNEGDLKYTVTRSTATGNPVLDKTYYRYYGEGDDNPGGVKYMYDYASLARAVADLGSEEAVFAANDGDIQKYASDYYTYNESGQVETQVSQGSGCSMCGGQGETSYSFSTSSATIEDDFDCWKYKKVEENTSGTTTTTYYNYRQEVLLTDEWNGLEGVDEQHWYTYNQYDANGHLVLTAHPSAVASYNDIYSEITETNLNVTLNAGSGLIDIYDYYDENDPEFVAAPAYSDLLAQGGGVHGYLYRSGVKEGSGGGDQWQTETNYTYKTVGDQTTYYTYQSISYTNVGLTASETTTYHYTFFTDTDVPVVKTVETILPVVAESENGPVGGSATSSIAVYDKMGRTVWTADAGGYITYTEYDPVSGGTSKQISDVDLAAGQANGDFTTDNLNLLSGLGWSTPGDGGLHLITTTEYDLQGRVIKQVDPSGAITCTVYNDAQNETRTYYGWDETTHLPTGAVSVYRTDLAGNYSESLTFVWTDPGGMPHDAGTNAPTGTESLTGEYVTIQSLSRSLMNDAGQTTQSREYFSLDGLTYSTDREFGTAGTHYLETVTTYDPLGRYAATENPDGTVTHTFYDRLGRTTQTWTGTDDVPETNYDGEGDTDLRDFRFWVAANPSATEGPAGTSMYLVSETIYDDGLDGGDSLVTESRSYHDTGYYSTFYHYDGQNRTTDTLSPGDIVTHYIYDYQGRTTETLTYASDDFTLASTELRAKTKTDYDSLGRDYKNYTYEIDPSDGSIDSFVTTETWYNDRGSVEQTQNELGKLTTYEYDGLGREIKVTQPDPDDGGAELAPWTVYDYDDAANSLTVTDRLGHDTVYQYDDLGRTVSETDANGDTTYYTYDGENLETLTDPEGNTTTWVYDLLGRVTEETNELDETQYFEYDSDGYLSQETNRNGQVIQYTYDFQGNTTGELWKEGAATVHEFTFTYDLLGRMLTASDSNASYVYTYDNAGRLYTETQTLDGLTPTVVLTYAYNDIGLLAQTATTIGGTADAVTDYTYDGFGRLESIQQDDVMGGNAVAEKRVDYTYDAAGQYDTITRYADLAATDLVVTGTYAYDYAGRLRSLTYTKGETTLVEHDWTYDAGNNMTQYVNSIDGTVDYTNDDAGQLLTADYDYLDDETYTYDDNGNRVTANGDTYTTDDNNQLASVLDSITNDTYVYEYDDEGNRTLKYIDTDSSGTLNAGDTDITTYDWDYRNRLTTVSHFVNYGDYSDPTPDPNQVVDYIYDYKNRLIGKLLDSDGDGDTDINTVYVHDDDQIIAQFTHTGTGGDAVASDLSHRYLWGEAVDQILADEAVTSLGTAGTITWPLIDHLNTTRDLATYNSGTTTIANHRTFDTYGNLTSETNSAVDSLFGFTGRLFDEDTALQNNLNRWYDPAVGRWLSQDPLGFDANDANLYRYCGNNPTNYTDPMGTSKKSGVKGSPNIAESACKLPTNDYYFFVAVDPGVKTPFGTIGHVWVGLYNPDTDKVIVQGMGPKKKLSYPGEIVPAEVRSEYKRKFVYACAFKINKQKYDAAVKKIYEKPADYQGRSHNCATWAIDVAHAAKVNLTIQTDKRKRLCLNAADPNNGKPFYSPQSMYESLSTHPGVGVDEDFGTKYKRK